MNQFEGMLKGLGDEHLAELRDAVEAAMESRRRRFNLEDIKPGMSKEQETAVRAEIIRMLQQSSR